MIVMNASKLLSCTQVMKAKFTAITLPTLIIVSIKINLRYEKCDLTYLYHITYK